MNKLKVEGNPAFLTQVTYLAIHNCAGQTNSYVILRIYAGLEYDLFIYRALISPSPQDVGTVILRSQRY